MSLFLYFNQSLYYAFPSSGFGTADHNQILKLETLGVIQSSVSTGLSDKRWTLYKHLEKKKHTSHVVRPGEIEDLEQYAMKTSNIKYV